MKIRRCNRSSFSGKKRDEEEVIISESIPFDLVIDIFMRLPAKSIARFRCVSKLYDSTLTNPYFTEPFYTISSSRPKLLFTVLKDGNTFFFSSPTPQDTSSRFLAVKFHMSFPIYCPYEIFRPVRGLVCGINQQTSKQGTVNVPLICNPSTGEILTLPNLNTKRKRGVTSYLGYDPIDKQFKVLCMTHIRHRRFNGSLEAEVLTLGTGTNPSWRIISCNIPHERVFVDRTSDHSAYDGICVNGVLYYLAYLYDYHTTGSGVVCFEFRSEKFKCIRLAQGMGRSYTTQSTLLNYKDKLALLMWKPSRRIPSSEMQLWVLEDAETHQWFSYTYIWPPPPPRKEVVAKAKSGKKKLKKIKLRYVGTSDTGEIVLSHDYITDHFKLFYYNPEKNNLRKVRIQGMEAFRPSLLRGTLLISLGFGPQFMNKQSI